jgi:hypothetical protein
MSRILASGFFESEVVPPYDDRDIIIEFSSNDFAIPTSGRKNNSAAAYAWHIFLDDVFIGRYNGVSSDNSDGILVTSTFNGTHTVRIGSSDLQYSVGWACAYGFWSNTSGANSLSNKAKIIKSSELDNFGHLYTSTNAGNYFRANQFYGCVNLTNCGTGNCGEGVTTIGDYYCYNRYNGCTSLMTGASEALPNSVISIGSYFRASYYKGCTSLTTAAAEALPNSVTKIGDWFRYDQYNTCTSLTTAAAEALPNSVTSVGSSFRYGQYAECTGLTKAANEFAFTPSVFNLSYYRCAQYKDCPNLRIGGYQFSTSFPSVIMTSGTYFYMFVLSSAISDSDVMPRYLEAGGTTTPVNALTPNEAKAFCRNRTGISGYDSLNANWK